MATVAAIIGARSGSVGVKNKNIRDVAGHPLLAYSVRAALLAGIKQVIVSTDSHVYANMAVEAGATLIFQRPAEISGPASTDYQFISHAVDVILATKDKLPDLFVHLRPTTPFRNPSIIEEAISTLEEDDAASSLRSVHEMPESAYKALEIASGYLAPLGRDFADMDDANAPRQGFDVTYSANGYVDVLRTAFILTHRKIHGPLVHAFITPAVIEVDVEEDFERLEYQAARHPEFVKRLFP